MLPDMSERPPYVYMIHLYTCTSTTCIMPSKMFNYFNCFDRNLVFDAL